MGGAASPDLSGEQIEIVVGTQRAVIASVGATLRSYSQGGVELIDGFGADEVCPGGRGQILMPWPNRVARGRYRFDGRHEQLPVDEVELGHAIHGLVRFCGWRVETRAGDRVRLGHRLEARPGYPFPLDLLVDYQLSPLGLTVGFAAHNVGERPCPFGAGAHPYLRFPDERADSVELCVPAREWLEVDDRSIPKARREVAGSAFDFRRPRAIGAAHLDHAFTGLERDAQGVARVRLRSHQRELTLWLDGSFGFVQVYTGDTLPDRARRRLGIAVEPTTCAPDAFNSGDGLIVLAPGASFAGRWGIAPSREGANR